MIKDKNNILHKLKIILKLLQYLNDEIENVKFKCFITGKLIKVHHSRQYYNEILFYKTTINISNSYWTSSICLQKLMS